MFAEVNKSESVSVAATIQVPDAAKAPGWEADRIEQAGHPDKQIRSQS